MRSFLFPAVLPSQRMNTHNTHTKQRRTAAKLLLQSLHGEKPREGEANRVLNKGSGESSVFL